MTKKKEIALNRALNKVYNIGFGLAPDHELEKYFAKKIMIIGTTADEKFTSLKGMRTLIKRQKEQSKGMAVSFKRKEVYRAYQAGENIAVVVEDILVTIKTKKEVIRFDVRSSAIMEFVDDKEWKLVHWHASKPEIVASEADTFGIDAWQQKTAELEQLVAERTADLQVKNRDLEIEAALERVRTVAMGMVRADDLLRICKIQYKELKKLGFTGIRNALIGIFHDDKHYFTDYDYSDFSGGAITNIPYGQNPVVDRSVKRMKSSSDAFTEFVVKGKELEEWKAFRKKNGEYEDERLKNVKSLYYYFYSIEQGNLGISTFQQISEEQLGILRRFRNVFDLAYKRYVDIAKAEAQARESLVELGLERVRAKAMAMQTSDELKGLIATVFTELKKLDLAFTRCVIMIYKGQKNDANWWMANSEDPDNPAGFYVKAHDHPPQAAYIKAWKEKKVTNTYILEGKIKKDWDLFLFRETELKHLPAFVIKGMKSPGKVYLNASFNNFGNLTLATLDPLSDDHFDILLRFAKVFDLTYTRFNDLQKAEAQAKEAQVQLALERVRARTMAMQHSNELSETAKVMFDQFNALGEAPERMAIEIVNEQEKVFEIWATEHGGSQLNLLLKVSIDEPHVMKKMYKAWKQKLQSITIDLQGNELEEYFQFLKKAGLPVQRKIFGKRRVQNVATFSKGILTIITPEPRPKETIEILERFASVFDGTYTRFLDLQKAEAQSREAQIELALERVRARTMAMQKSDELADTSLVLFQQLKELGEPAEQLSIGVVNEAENIVEVTVTIDGDAVQHIFRHSIDEPILMNKIYKAWKAQEKVLIVEIKGKDLVTYNKFRDELIGTSLFSGKTYKDDRRIVHSAFFSRGMLALATNQQRPPASLQLLERFAKVFDGTYTRFLDLQKAEAQAKEAKIEAALEKVRSSTMAMQRSADLADVSRVLFMQMNALVPNLWSCGFVLCDKNNTNDEWYLSGGNGYMPDLVLPNVGDRTHHNIYRAWLQGATYHQEIVEGEDLNKHYEWLMTIPVAKAAFEAQAKAGIGKPVWQQLSCAFFTQGYLVLITEIPIVEEEILKRFAKVFEQTYTRFLDLQKAEAQGKEARIEAALEKVRSRSLAMQKSEELREVIQVVYEQFVHLNVNTEHTGFVIDYKQRDDRLIWVASKHGVPAQLTIPYFDSEYYNSFNEAKDKGLDFFATNLSFEAKNNFYHELFKYIPDLPDEAKTFYFDCPGLAISTVLLEDVGLYIENFEGIPYSDEDNAILMRFGKVFQQTYTRFLDLQKAEAQAREAEIELALERVRARTMAMQNPSEFVEVITVIGEQFVHLGFDIEWVNFGANGLDLSEGIDTWNFAVVPGSDPIASRLFIPSFDHPLFMIAKERLDQYLRTGDDFFEMTFNKIEKDKWLDHLFTSTFFKDVPEEYRVIQYAKPGYITSNLLLKDTFLSIGKFDTRSFTGEQHAIFRKFGNAFGQAFTRFLDLQKAEVQVKEAQVEAALEKVRSRSLAMHKSDEIKEVVKTVVEKIQELDIEMNGGISLVTFDAGSKDMHHWLWIPGQLEDTFKAHLPWFDHVMFDDCNKAREEGAELFAAVYAGKDKDTYFDHLFNRTDFKYGPQAVKAWVMEQPYFGFSFAIQKNSGIFLNDYTGKYFSKETNDILVRFSKVFEQSYIRFIDLQRAEAQAKEAMIEAALEKVRSRSLAMHKSEELQEVVTTVFERLKDLGIRTDAINLDVFKENKKDAYLWTAVPGAIYSKEFHIPYTDAVIFKDIYEGMSSGKGMHTKVYTREEKNEFLEHIFAHSDFKQIPQERKDLLFAIEGSTVAAAYAANTAIIAQRYAIDPFTDEETDILKRFANVFEQSYTRFKDLERAEAQSREAQIELSLERVRAKTMAMHNSEDVGGTVAMLFDELQKLGVETLRCGIGIMEQGYLMELWTAKADEEGKAALVMGHMDMKLHPLLKGAYESWMNKTDHYSYLLQGDDLINYFTAINDYPAYPVQYTIAKLPGTIFHNEFHFPEGTLFAFSTAQLSEEQRKIFKRFAGVFGQTYRRYLDLQKAEAQAREAQIEAALERVRSKTMAMQKSDDLAEAVRIVFDELDKLDLGMLRCGIGIMKKENRSVDVWTTTKSDNNTVVQVAGDESMDLHPLLAGAYDAWLKQENYSYILEGDDLRIYYQSLARGNFRLPDSQSLVSETEGVVQYYYNAIFASGGLFAFRDTPFPEEARLVLGRFAEVFSFTYTRFNDLKQVEAQARESQIQLGLERVRARTMSMQKSDELAETAAEVFRQLITLGIEPNRLYIGIVKDNSGDMEMWATDEDGTKLGHKFLFNRNENSSVGKLYEGWAEKKTSVVVDMQGQELKDYFDYLTNVMHIPFKGGLAQKRRVQTVAYFSKGFIGMASPDEQPAEIIQLLERFAAVFNLTFTRFNDLKVAEAHAIQAELDLKELIEEKKRTEEALSELQVTQKQLIQSEKMASLGELTAGIAHEIQNPLNFVNNFSEVSNELLDEMIDEIKKGNFEEVEALVNDVKQNLEKINHHGKRADGIVKGMLQHSRSSSATKEPTDINKLADEYLRLAYHGLRAKDKSFNATLKTDYDAQIGMINIVPQDIGRVVLNLITNAFYVVAEKKKQAGPGYEPTVSLATKKTGDKIEICVSDNGNGIPAHVLDKIFQPFYTTKPTGQGTGLGLSLSYDIVKAHGGELKVETTEGEGSVFIIQLPIQSS